MTDRKPDRRRFLQGAASASALLAADTAAFIEAVRAAVRMSDDAKQYAAASGALRAAKHASFCAAERVVAENQLALDPHKRTGARIS